MGYDGGYYREIGDLLGQGRREVFAGSHATRGSTPLETANDLDGCWHTAVGEEQCLFKSFPRLGVIRVEGNGLDLARQRLARLGEPVDEPTEEPPTLLGCLDVWLSELDVAKAREHQVRVGHGVTNRSATGQR